LAVDSIDFLQKLYLNDSWQQMIFPEERYRFSSNKPLRKKTAALRIAVLLAVVAAVIAGVVLLIRGGLFSGMRIGAGSQKDEIIQLWDEKEYGMVLEASNDMLEEEPLNGTGLAFKGFSAFYVALNQITEEEKLLYLEDSIRSLRKALLLSQKKYAPEIEYILGKAYFQKGHFYYDLSIQYLRSSIEHGYVKEDSYEYLGLAYSQLQDYEKSIEYFLKAAEKNPTDLLYLTLAQSYFKTADFDQAELYINRAIDRAQDTYIKQKAYFLLGDILREDREYDRAKDVYRKILDISPESANAYFYLGEIAEQQGDIAAARASWRDALRYDPNHLGALNRLNSY
jgi:tetratricopeptide (TPR) repeat protein